MHTRRHHQRSQGDRGGRQDHAWGARTSKDPAPHLLAALDQATGAVLTQQRVAGKSNEIPALRDLLEPLDLDGVVVTADAMHTQTGTAQWITRRGGHYLLTVKGNQKTRRKTLKALPWKSVPSVSSVDTGHGRRVRRTAKAIEAPAWVDFPGAAQVVQLRRTRIIKSRKHVEVVYLICSLPMTDAQPRSSRPGSKGTGESRTDFTGSGTWSSMRTATSCAPATAQRSWPPCVTWPSASSDSSTAPPSPAPPDPCHDNPNEPSDYSPKPPPKPTLPTPWGFVTALPVPGPCVGWLR